MKSFGETSRFSSRSMATFMLAALTGLALSTATASAAPYAYNRVDATDSCRDIREVRVRAGWWVDSVQLVCRDGLKPRRGGAGGGLHVFRLHSGEYITGISGTHGGPAGHYVNALQIHTNLRASPVYGEAGRYRGSKRFHYRASRDHFVTGLSTRSGRYLEKIKLNSNKIRYQVARDRNIGHGCRKTAEVRVRQTPWGSELEVICARGPHARRAKHREWKSFYHPAPPRHYDGRLVSRNKMRKPGRSFKKRH